MGYSCLQHGLLCLRDTPSLVMHTIFEYLYFSKYRTSLNHDQTDVTTRENKYYYYYYITSTHPSDMAAIRGVIPSSVLTIFKSAPAFSSSFTHSVCPRRAVLLVYLAVGDNEFLETHKMSFGCSKH